MLNTDHVFALGTVVHYCKQKLGTKGSDIMDAATVKKDRFDSLTNIKRAPMALAVLKTDMEKVLLYLLPKMLRPGVVETMPMSVLEAIIMLFEELDIDGNGEELRAKVMDIWRERQVARLFPMSPTQVRDIIRRYGGLWFYYRYGTSRGTSGEEIVRGLLNVEKADHADAIRFRLFYRSGIDNAARRVDTDGIVYAFRPKLVFLGLQDLTTTIQSSAPVLMTWHLQEGGEDDEDVQALLSTVNSQNDSFSARTMFRRANGVSLDEAKKKLGGFRVEDVRDEIGPSVEWLDNSLGEYCTLVDRKVSRSINSNGADVALSASEEPARGE